MRLSTKPCYSSLYLISLDKTSFTLKTKDPSFFGVQRRNVPCSDHFEPRVPSLVRYPVVGGTTEGHLRTQSLPLPLGSHRKPFYRKLPTSRQIRYRHIMKKGRHTTKPFLQLHPEPSRPLFGVYPSVIARHFMFVTSTRPSELSVTLSLSVQYRLSETGLSRVLNVRLNSYFRLAPEKCLRPGQTYLRYDPDSHRPTYPGVYFPQPYSHDGHGATRRQGDNPFPETDLLK